MTDNKQDYLQSNVYHFTQVLLRGINVLVVGYLFYRLIVSKADIFLNASLFALSWITFFVLSAAVTISIGFIGKERHPRSYVRQLLYLWPILFGMAGVFVFYLFPFALPLF
jgi:hypothetical protein